MCLCLHRYVYIWMDFVYTHLYTCIGRFLLSWSLQWWSSCLTPEISTLMTPTSIITTKASDKTFSNVFDQKGDLSHRTSHQLIHLLRVTKYLLPPNQLLFWFPVPFRKDTRKAPGMELSSHCSHYASGLLVQAYLNNFLSEPLHCVVYLCVFIKIEEYSVSICLEIFFLNFSHPVWTGGQLLGTSHHCHITGSVIE